MTNCTPTQCTPTETGTVTRTQAQPTRVDIVELENEFRVDADVPGASKDDVDVRFENGVLSFSATLPEPAAAHPKTHLREFSGRRTEREFRLGDSIDTDAITARVEHGVLSIRLPKAERAQPRKIEIQ
ncbi:MAG: hypothetical protein DHS20C21_12010 [Gemmatimonadota bacterium]|nr:MAG: hypothetical protein DHS20C21_12010 [Gemmatimonadota bacterium]